MLVIDIILVYVNTLFAMGLFHSQSVRPTVLFCLCNALHKVLCMLSYSSVVFLFCFIARSDVQITVVLIEVMKDITYNGWGEKWHMSIVVCMVQLINLVVNFRNKIKSFLGGFMNPPQQSLNWEYRGHSQSWQDGWLAGMCQNVSGMNYLHRF